MVLNIIVEEQKRKEVTREKKQTKLGKEEQIIIKANRKLRAKAFFTDARQRLDFSVRCKKIHRPRTSENCVRRSKANSPDDDLCR